MRGKERWAVRFGHMGLVALFMLTFLVGSSAAAPLCSAGTCTETFTFTGAAQTWTVPPGVTSATFHVQGAQGGGSDGSSNCLGITTTGGKGGEAIGTFAVTPNATLQVNVGGQGGGCSSSGFGSAGGFNGGGNGGTQGGTGGGGASDIRTGSYAFADRIIVAGGGGGSALFGSAGGVGGGASGGDSTPPTGGKGGTQTDGGDGGTNACLPFPGTPVGGPGSLGTGGAGAPGEGLTTGGSGGGGGYYGGGGGGFGRSGCAAGGGGGGSGFVASGATNPSMQSGVREANGLVTITYEQPSVVPTCDGFTATIYVNTQGQIVGGPNNGQVYRGKLNGTPGADVIVGTDGNDEIAARAGNDRVCARDGNDEIEAGGGNDRIFGEGGNDEMYAGGGNDTMTGGLGADKFRGGAGTDTATDFTPAQGDTKTGVEVF